MASILTGVVATAALFVAGSFGDGRPHPAGDPKSPNGSPTLGPSTVRPGFVLSPTWLPSGWSASGGGYVDPVGGLRLGNNVGVSVNFPGPGGSPRPDPSLFTLSYYGYHDPETKTIFLNALRYGPTPSAKTSVLGGRHVFLTTRIDPTGFVAVTDTTARWVERGIYFDISAQGVSEQQLARFVAGLKEVGPPRNVMVPAHTSGLSQLAACESLSHAGFHCVAQFQPQASSLSPGTVVGTNPRSGASAPYGSYVSLVVSSSGTLSTVANVVGLSYDQAKNDLQRSGFVADETCRSDVSGTPEGVVSTQDPTAGSPVEQGSLVHLVVVRSHC
jgi:hypothetical protein